MAGLRVVLDTNVIISGLTYPASIPGCIVTAWRQGTLDVVISRHILDEMKRVLPKMRKSPWRGDELRDLIDSLMFLVDILEPDTQLEPGLRDVSHQPVLATFRVAQADYLITGDKDLLALARTYPIVTPAEFWSKHGG